MSFSAAKSTVTCWQFDKLRTMKIVKCVVESFKTKLYSILASPLRKIDVIFFNFKNHEDDPNFKFLKLFNITLNFPPRLKCKSFSDSDRNQSKFWKYYKMCQNLNLKKSLLKVFKFIGQFSLNISSTKFSTTQLRYIKKTFFQLSKKFFSWNLHKQDYHKSPLNNCLTDSTFYYFVKKRSLRYTKNHINQ